MPKLYGQSLIGAKCALYGLARTNLAVARYLLYHGAEVFVSDKRMSDREVQNTLLNFNCEGANYFKYGEAPRCDYIFRTPVMRADCPELVAESEKGARITDEIRLFLENTKGDVIGVTGSDGKTTTCSITAKILEKSFFDKERQVFLGGNIGSPLVDFLDIQNENDVTVAELSSFQLMYSDMSPDISGITNITENHLDWHKDMEEYISAKSRIYKQNRCRKLVTDSETKRKFGITNKTTVVNYDYIKVNKCGYSCFEGSLYKQGEAFLNTDEVRIKGEHNLKNLLLSAALTEEFADIADIRAAAWEFTGVPHRMTLVHEKNGVKYYDSSIDSTPSRAMATLKCFSKPLTVIVGGYDKNLDYKDLAQYLSKKTNNVVLTGASAEKILFDLERESDRNCKIFKVETFEDAVKISVCMAEKDASLFGSANVVLSPACASFDQFKDYAERGDKFIEMVKSC